MVARRYFFENKVKNLLIAPMNKEELV
jgi:hypothetical protein